MAYPCKDFFYLWVHTRNGTDCTKVYVIASFPFYCEQKPLPSQPLTNSASRGMLLWAKANEAKQQLWRSRRKKKWMRLTKSIDIQRFYLKVYDQQIKERSINCCRIRALGDTIHNCNVVVFSRLNGTKEKKCQCAIIEQGEAETDRFRSRSSGRTVPSAWQPSGSSLGQ